ncbi:predicted protein [Arabidopsis lyrata subsp. lyrata]|uniref:Predicted protein n=1 Tax=Arabidopsis lyrata subsp. lyrata TaxID=81972 RepID=D7LFI6_ARALL|nr:predicted protein [Arabidopsis lyrata subsp. lyrata]
MFMIRDTLIKVGASLVYLAGDVVRGGSGGSGFFNRNMIVTTYNVLLKLRAPYYIGKEIVVTLYTGAIVIRIISSYDSDRDLCLINIHDSKIEGTNITWSKFSSDQPKQGQLVGALGAPLLLPNSFSMGAISYVNRLIEDIDNPLDFVLARYAGF